MRVLSTLYYLYYLDEFFRQCYRCFCEMLLVNRIFRHLWFCYGCITSCINLPAFLSKLFSYSTRISEYRVGKMVWIFTCYFRFGVNLKTCLFIFYTFYISIFVWISSNSSRVDFFKGHRLDKTFLVKFYHSCVNFSNLKGCATDAVIQIMAACVRILGSQYHWSCLQGRRIPWYNMVSNLDSC